ncbi:hypothetical protein SADUNF_Sadunf01G0036300 [Salix dunnii]|uniref:Uncharacterized protein n=1 Tax=Salix dunnii TaxID=1413687 RepID=A0A835TJV5_9ROSI|nr:hypothetical protein SADUNF_Sadunf01G0036300 [Salix dunnii]
MEKMREQTPQGLISRVKKTAWKQKTSTSSWYSDTKGLAKKRNKMATGLPNIFASLDQWKPNLDSIVEEHEGN